MNFMPPVPGIQPRTFVRLRCACCGTDSFGDGSMKIPRAGKAPGMLCETCLTFADRSPNHRRGIDLAIAAGVCLADVAQAFGPALRGVRG